MEQLPDQRQLPHIPESHTPPTTAQMVESLLFVSAEPVTVVQLARALDLPVDTIEEALSVLEASCRSRGIRVQRFGEQVQLVSAPEASQAIMRLLGVHMDSRLSSAALEVLALISYRQPITRAGIEDIRGVDSSGVIRALLARDLIVEAGRLETAGRPILYATTPEFMRQFGLTNLSELPPLDISLPDTDV